MATPFQDVYSFFLSKISDYSFLKLTQDELEEYLIAYLKSAITKFDNCKVDLSDRSDSANLFNQTLSEKEQDILATLMVAEYLRPRVVTTKLFEQAMSDSDFKIYSQSNHIAQLLNLYSKMQADAQSLMTKYSYSKMNLDNFS